MAEKHIYILRLEEGKYYIGKSENPSRRYEAHLAGTGSSWTKKYPPIELITVIENSSAFDEDKYTKEYMAAHGIDNVRGGSYVTMEISDAQKEFLTREIRGAKDLCARCGVSGHFIRQCPLEPPSVPVQHESPLVHNEVPPTLTIPNPVFVLKNFFEGVVSRVHNEFNNPDSDLRSGRLDRDLRSGRFFNLNGKAL